MSLDNPEKWDLKKVKLAISGGRHSFQNIHDSPWDVSLFVLLIEKALGFHWVRLSFLFFFSFPILCPNLRMRGGKKKKESVKENTNCSLFSIVGIPFVCLNHYCTEKMPNPPFRVENAVEGFPTSTTAVSSPPKSLGRCKCILIC